MVRKQYFIARRDTCFFEHSKWWWCSSSCVFRSARKSKSTQQWAARVWESLRLSLRVLNLIEFSKYKSNFNLILTHLFRTSKLRTISWQNLILKSQISLNSECFLKIAKISTPNFWVLQRWRTCLSLIGRKFPSQKRWV